MSKISYLMSNDKSLSIVARGKSYTVQSDHPSYAQIVEAIKKDDDGAIATLADVGKRMNQFVQSEPTVNADVKVENGTVTYKGEPVPLSISDRVIAMMGAGLPATPLLNFINNVMQNPSYRAAQELFNFLDRDTNRFPLTEDGCFLAYKAVSSTWKDKYSGKFDNSVGKTPSMPRNHVNEDPNVECSNGLHVGTIGYVNGFKGEGDHVIIVKVNPADAVSVPAHDWNKMRVCKYLVIAEYTGDLNQSPVYSNDAKPVAGDPSSYNNTIQSSDDDDDDDDVDDEEGLDTDDDDVDDELPTIATCQACGFDHTEEDMVDFSMSDLAAAGIKPGDPLPLTFCVNCDKPVYAAK